MEKSNDLMSGKGENGKWITVNGSHIFVEDGQSVEDAMDVSFNVSPKHNKSTEDENRGESSLNGELKTAIVYHGTNFDFDKFSEDEAIKNKKLDDLMGSGFYFADTPEQAKLYGEKVYKVELKYSTDYKMSKKSGREKDFLYSKEKGVWRIPYKFDNHLKIIDKQNS